MRVAKREPSWTFLNAWRQPPPLEAWDAIERWMAAAVGRGTGAPAETWGAVESWIEAAEASAASVEADLQSHLGRWTTWLEPLGEISTFDWRSFRPLRLAREEGWSDWLAHLLEKSGSGAFAKTLFGSSIQLAGVRSFAHLNVAREVTTSGNERRADILIEWANVVAHIEVKVGDQNLAKTYETAALLERDYAKGRDWADFILLLPADNHAWEVASREAPREVQMITWTDVAVALRRSLRRSDEELPWRAWAHSFCGAVEQRLLGCEPVVRGKRRQEALVRLAAGLTQLGILKRSEA